MTIVLLCDQRIDTNPSKPEESRAEGARNRPIIDRTFFRVKPAACADPKGGGYRYGSFNWCLQKEFASAIKQHPRPKAGAPVARVKA